MLVAAGVGGSRYRKFAETTKGCYTLKIEVLFSAPDDVEIALVSAHIGTAQFVLN